MNRMNRFTRIITGALLSVAMIFTMMPLSGAVWEVSAEDTDSTVSEIAEQFADPENDPFGHTSEEAQKNAVLLGEQLPSSFDLRNVDTDGDGTRDTSYVTHVKFQNPFGNCWGFAAISAAETSILSDPELGTGLSPDDIDLSEKHLSYFAATPINDPDSPQNGEGVIGGETVQETMDLGGRAFTATSLFSAGVGPVMESADKNLEYKGKAGEVEKEWVDGKYDNYCYSYDDDWSLPESMRFMSSYSLNESYIVPSPVIRIDLGFDTEYQYNAAGTSAIKEQLYKGRGVQIGYWDDTFNPLLGEEHGEFISGNWAQYTFGERGPRHAVCIVGWDDNYPRENFIEGQQPPEDMFPDGQREGETGGGNGAWLVKNSWGSGEEEFPDHGEGIWGIQVPVIGENGDPVLDENGEPVTTGSGYFWLSYYDQSIGTPEALDFAKMEEDGTYLIDQHDLMPVEELKAANVEEEVRMANIFTASSSEELQQVSCVSSYPGTKARFDIYLLGKNYKSPTDGLLMDTVESTFEYGGFHKVALNKPFNIMKGQSYAVVVTMKTPEEKYAVYIQANFGGDDEDALAKGVINKGESLLLIDGKWQDLSDRKLQVSLLEQCDNSSDDMTVDNFPIKGFAEKQPNLRMELNGAEQISLPYVDEDGEDTPPAYFMLSIIGDKDLDISKTDTKWTLEDGADNKIVSLADGRDPSRKSITAKRCGRTYMTVEAFDSSTGKVIGTIYHPIILIPSVAYIEEMEAGKSSLTLTMESNDPREREGFEVKYRVKGTKKWTVKEFDASSKELVLKGLKQGKRYQVKVRTWVTDSQGRLYGASSFVNLSDKIGGNTTGTKKNTLSASGKTISVKYSALKKNDQKFKRSKAITVKKARGTVTYKKVSGNKKITISKKTGKLTVKKGLKKGTYKVKIKVRAAGTSQYKAGSKTVTVTVRIK